jgi:hypothetical protein
MNTAEDTHTSTHETDWQYVGLPASRVARERYALRVFRNLLPWVMDYPAFGARECQQSCWREHAGKRLERL